MELPIQLKFFKKIELYQEYKFEERKASGTRLTAWNIEKQILKWTTNNHHHLGSPLVKEDIKRRMLEDKEPTELNQALQNLILRGYADGSPEGGVRITRAGLLMGEVINELEGRVLLRYKYIALFWLVWITAIAGALIVIINLFKLIF
jgi:hypothetical protein